MISVNFLYQSKTKNRRSERSKESCNKDSFSFAQKLHFYFSRTQVTEKHVIFICEKNPGFVIFEKERVNDCSMEMAIIFIVGMLIGCIFSAVIYRIKSVGSLRIDTSDPDDDPYLFLELSKDVGTVRRKKYVVLKVNTQNFIPHK